MPTVLRVGPYRFFFYASDHDEPIHIHVRRDRYKARFWLWSVALAVNKGFPDHQLKQIEKLVTDHRQELIREWHDYFGT
ncbi:DUF4160 domain-containing protein [soil metagenome]